MKNNILFYGLLIIMILLCLMLGTAAPVPQVVNRVGIFNSALNYGWLHAAIGNGMFQHEWENYAKNGRLWLINAFSPPLKLYEWKGNSQDALNAISGIKGILQQYQGQPWLALFNGGIGLAVAHITAQHGRCPTCLKNTLWTAGNDIEIAGKLMNNQNIINIGINMKNVSSTMPANNMTTQQIQAYTNVLAEFMRSIQAAL